jgi:hypothetical protein
MEGGSGGSWTRKSCGFRRRGPGHDCLVGTGNTPIQHSHRAHGVGIVSETDQIDNKHCAVMIRRILGSHCCRRWTLPRVRVRFLRSASAIWGDGSWFREIGFRQQNKTPLDPKGCGAPSPCPVPKWAEAHPVGLAQKSPFKPHLPSLKPTPLAPCTHGSMCALPTNLYTAPLTGGFKRAWFGVIRQVVDEDAARWFR